MKTELQKTIETNYLAYELSHELNEDSKKVFEAGFLAGIEYTASRVIQSNDQVINQIDGIVARVWDRFPQLKEAQKAAKAQQNT